MNINKFDFSHCHAPEQITGARSSRYNTGHSLYEVVMLVFTVAFVGYCIVQLVTGCVHANPHP